MLTSAKTCCLAGLLLIGASSGAIAQQADPQPSPSTLRASHNCGTKSHVPALEEGVETAETPRDGFRAGWLVAA